jgi:hypothetical protein
MDRGERRRHDERRAGIWLAMPETVEIVTVSPLAP